MSRDTFDFQEGTGNLMQIAYSDQVCHQFRPKWAIISSEVGHWM